MAKIEDILEIQRNIVDSLDKRMTDFELQLKSSLSTDSSKPNLEKLHSDYKEFKSSVWNILGLLKSLILNLASQIDDVDNQSRRNALLFGGIEESDGENLTSKILSTIQVLMGFSDIQPSSIQHCHRLGVRSNNRIRPILVRFTNLDVRNSIWRNKKKLKSSPVVLSEFLTKTRQTIFLRARKHFGIKNCWTLHGAIYIKLDNNEKLRILSSEQLDDLIIKHPTAVSSPTIGTVPDGEAAPLDRRKGTPSSAVKPSVGPVTRRQAVKKL